MPFEREVKIQIFTEAEYTICCDVWLTKWEPNTDYCLGDYEHVLNTVLEVMNVFRIGQKICVLPSFGEY